MPVPLWNVPAARRKWESGYVVRQTLYRIRGTLARVELTANGRKQYRWIHSNHTYKSGGALDAHFGLGAATTAEGKVVLLDGRMKVFSNLACDQTHHLEVLVP